LTPKYPHTTEVEVHDRENDGIDVDENGEQCVVAFTL
jgi:hypothetical protein